MALDRVAGDTVGAVGELLPVLAEALLDFVQTDHVDAAGEQARLPRLRQQYLDPLAKVALCAHGRWWRWRRSRSARRGRPLRLGRGYFRVKHVRKIAPQSVHYPVLRLRHLSAL